MPTSPLSMPLARLALAAVLAALAATALVPAAHAADGITKGALYESGPDNRYLMGGQWLFRLDDADTGVRQGFHKSASRSGWNGVSVPNAWNAQDESNESMAGSTGWYRKDFRLPTRSSRFSWVVRFESVNYRATVWLNGRRVGYNRGAYLPWEVRLPASALKRSGTNRLVVRVTNKRFPFDFPPSGLTVDGTPTGGWWNYGGILREVYLRGVDRVDMDTVQVRPDLPCARCTATVNVRVRVRNHDSRAQRVSVRGSYGGRALRLGSRTVGAGRLAAFTARIRVARPRLWEPGSPRLYRVRLSASVGSRKVVGWTLRSGIRSIKVSSDGLLMLNGKRVNFRGVGLHEDDPEVGFALDNRRREQIVARTRELGATLMRAHYPLHPHMHELADRQGVMVWSEIPVYAIKTKWLKSREVRTLAANELRDNILANQNHPSIITWSIGNELSARPGPVQGDYIARAVRQAKKLDPTRPVSYAVAGYPTAGCQTEYAPLDIIGVNEYFGWYPGPNGVIADRDALTDYLDSVRACYPNKAVVVSEFGAEANRSGPVEEKGTYEHQQDFINYHLGVYETKPWLSGASYWTLQEFRVRPNWEGGNPRPSPPIHQKAVLAFDGTKKPGWFDLQRRYQATRQLRGAR